MTHSCTWSSDVEPCNINIPVYVFSSHVSIELLNQSSHHNKSSTTIVIALPNVQSYLTNPYFSSNSCAGVAQYCILVECLV